MLNLLLDIFISSTTMFSTSFIVFDFINKHSFAYIATTAILVALFTLNIYYFLIIIFNYYFLNYAYKYFKHKNLLFFLGYLSLINIKINLVSFITFLIILCFYNCKFTK